MEAGVCRVGESIARERGSEWEAGATCRAGERGADGEGLVPKQIVGKVPKIGGARAGEPGCGRSETPRREGKAASGAGGEEFQNWENWIIPLKIRTLEKYHQKIHV